MKQNENDGKNGNDGKYSSHASHSSHIHQTNFLIDRQLRRLERDFLEQGGLRERMTCVRLANRNHAPQNDSHSSRHSYRSHSLLP